jgi:spore coat protein A
MNRMLNRREFLKFGALAGAALMVPQSGFAKKIFVDGTPQPEQLPHPESPVAPRPFAASLPIPRVLAPAAQDETTDYYEMTARQARVSILPNTSTTIWGYEGEFPGPTIVARRGRRVVLRQTNDLDEDTTVHLHGGVVPPGMDGQPMDPIHPGETREYIYPNDQQAATLWYHDHAMDATGKHCYLGMCGFYIINDDVEEALPLPKGAYDVPLAITDRTFNADGSFHYPEIEGETLLYGALGDTILVNGAVQPHFKVATRKYRFRVLNASNARPYELALSSGQSFTQIGSDGGLLPAPVERQTIRIDAAERYDVVIDFSSYPVGSRVVLQNLLGADQRAAIMCFDVAREESDDSDVPVELAAIERHDPATAVAERNIEFGMDMERGLWLLNGKPYSHDNIEFRPRLGTTEIWRISNGAPHHDPAGTMPVPDGGDFAHPFHMHGVFFQVLDRNGEAPPPWEQGWKDTVSVAVREAVRVIASFDGYPGTYMFHCHKLEHEDRGMMAHFEVVDEAATPDDRANQQQTDRHQHHP